MGYKGPNENLEDFLEREHTVIYMVQVSYPEEETMTRGSLYNFAVLNSPITGHLGKMIISPNW